MVGCGGADCLNGVGFCTQGPYDIPLRGLPGWVGWLAFVVVFAAALAFVPKSHTTSPCGGCRSLFFADAKKSDRQPPQGDVVWLLGTKANAAAKTTTNASQPTQPGSPRRGMSYGPWVQKPTPFKQSAPPQPTIQEPFNHLMQMPIRAPNK